MSQCTYEQIRSMIYFHLTNNIKREFLPACNKTSTKAAIFSYEETSALAQKHRVTMLHLPWVASLLPDNGIDLMVDLLSLLLRDPLGVSAVVGDLMFVGIITLSTS